MSQLTSATKSTHLLFQDKALQVLARREDVVERMLSKFDLLQLSIQPEFTARRLHSGDGMVVSQSCTRCIFLRAKVDFPRSERSRVAKNTQGISPKCLSCSKVTMGMRYKKQLAFRVNFLDKNLLLPGEIAFY
jgi:hypothetical protein